MSASKLAVCSIASLVLLTAGLAQAETATAETTATATTETSGTPSPTHKTMNDGPAEIFGGKGQIAISSDAAIIISSTSVSGGADKTTTFQLHPALDYFVTQNISVGGFLGVDYSKTGDAHQTTFGIGPRVGYNLTLSDLVSIWPKIGFSYSSKSTSVTVNGVSGSVSSSSAALNLFVPIMFHPVQHFFAGFGPFLDTDLSGDTKTTVFGGKLTVGGWL